MQALLENCQNTEFFSSIFSRICTEYGHLLRKSSYLVQMREITDQKNSVFVQFLRSENNNSNCNICNFNSIDY